MVLDIILGVLLTIIIILLIVVITRLTLITKSQANLGKLNEIETLRENLSNSEREIKDVVRSNQETLSNTLTNQLKSSSETLVNTLNALGIVQKQQLETVSNSTNTLTQSNETRIETVRKTLDERIQTLQDSNEKNLTQMRQTVTEQLQTIQENNETKLEQMRKTVDEQLQSTLEKRLTESFKIVSDRLEAVQRGLGTMQNLAAGVGNLQRVLTNVSTRGTWGEVQLGAILEEILTPDQYGTNVRPHEGSERVEYAIRLPGNSDDSNSCVWLPIDSKFPLADYQRLIDAAEIVDKESEQTAIKSLMNTLQSEAKSISQKYIAPPHTTDFAIMFLPTEGLYAEILRQPGKVEELLQKYRIVVAGPTNLAAILISLRVGFRTLAIQEHSTEIKNVLAAVKTEFDKFAGIMDKLHRQLNTASNTVESTSARTRAMARHLRDFEELPQDEATKVFGLDSIEIDNE